MSRTLDYLEMLKAGNLPRQITDAGELDLVHVLRLAGWITAELPKSKGGTPQVTGITFPGQVLMEKARAQARHCS